MSYTPEQGDIIELDFDPSAGKEIIKRRPAFVVSKKMLNEHTGFAIVAPITNTVKNIGLEVKLVGKLATTGAIIIYQMRSLDFNARNAVLIGQAPQMVIAEALKKAKLIIS